MLQIYRIFACRMCIRQTITRLLLTTALTVAALCCTVLHAAAQERGTIGIGPRIGVYARTGGEPVYGIGAELRLNLSDALRIAPSATWLFNSGCTFEAECDLHLMLRTARHWYIYPLAGVSYNDIRGKKFGIDAGLGTDYAVGRHIDLSAGVRWIVELNQRRAPMVVWLGTTFKFGGKRR